MVVWAILDHFGPVLFPAVPQPLPKSENEPRSFQTAIFQHADAKDICHASQLAFYMCAPRPSDALQILLRFAHPKNPQRAHTIVSGNVLRELRSYVLRSS